MCRRKYLRKYYQNQPRFIKAKFQSVCNETKQTINIGEECLYWSKKVYHMDSETVRLHLSEEFDKNVLGYGG
jgi:hypothetical protein